MIQDQTSGAQDIIGTVIFNYYKNSGGLFGESDIREIQSELRIMYNIQIEDRVLDRRIKEYMSSLFSNRGGIA
jgi:hypothetical protein